MAGMAWFAATPRSSTCCCGPAIACLGHGALEGGLSRRAPAHRRPGLHRVIATTSSAAKAERLTALGADAVVDYTEHPEWGKQVLELTQGRGVDRVVEVGGPGTFGQSLLASGTHGAEIALIGFLGAGGPDVPFMDLFRSGITLRKINVGSRQDTEDLLDLLARHPVEPVVDSVFPFGRALDALRHFESRTNLGKVVITI